MSTTRALTSLGAETRKLSAFLRRDFLIAISYRMAFLTDWVAMVAQLVIFNFVGEIVRPGSIPEFGGSRPSYVEFVAVGIAVSSFMAVALGRIYTAVRQEQVQGTLESLLLTPTALTTIQLGSVIYDVAYVPIRTFVFLGLTSLVFGTNYDWSGLVPALIVLLAFIPFVWGLGVVAAAWTLTFRRGTGAVGLVSSLLTLSAGTYFPIDVFPVWAEQLLRWNPIAIALQATRDALLGGASVTDVLPTVLALIPAAAGSMWIGIFAFRRALERERRKGTLGLY